MPAINLNTASYEDLIELEGIGQHRATPITGGKGLYNRG